MTSPYLNSAGLGPVQGSISEPVAGVSPIPALRNQEPPTAEEVQELTSILEDVFHELAKREPEPLMSLADLYKGQQKNNETALKMTQKRLYQANEDRKRLQDEQLKQEELLAERLNSSKLWTRIQEFLSLCGLIATGPNVIAIAVATGAFADTIGGDFVKASIAAFLSRGDKEREERYLSYLRSGVALISSSLTMSAAMSKITSVDKLGQAFNFVHALLTAGVTGHKNILDYRTANENSKMMELRGLVEQSGRHSQSFLDDLKRIVTFIYDQHAELSAYMKFQFRIGHEMFN